jgi:P22 coat protein - gene protein 5
VAANAVINPTWVMKEIGRRLLNNWKFANNVERGYDDQYNQAGAKMGYTVNARLPQRYQVNKGQALNPQPVSDLIVPITLTDQANVGIEFSTASLTMEVDNYKEKCIAPAVDTLVNAADFDGLNRMYQETFRTVGTPGVVPGSTGTFPQAFLNVYLGAGVKLTNGAVPMENRRAMLNASMHAFAVSSTAGLFNPSEKISANYRKGQFGNGQLGIEEWYLDQNVATHVVGPLGGTPAVSGANQSGSSLLTSGWTASGLRLRRGDVIQVAGVFDINPLSYQSTGSLMDFVVTNDVTSDAGGLATIPIAAQSGQAAIVGPGTTRQNVSALPANGALISVFSTAAAGHPTLANTNTPQGLVYFPEAFAMVMADLQLPQGLWASERISNKALNLAIRFLKSYDIMSDQSPARVDILYGWKAVRPEMAVRVCS